MKLTNNPSKDFAPAPSGMHRGVCVDIIDLGLIAGFGGKMQHKINFVFEVLDALMEDGRPFLVFRRFTATLAETGHLAPFLSKWRGGVPIKQGEEIDLDTFIGKGASIYIAHVQSTKGDGKIYANIDLALPCSEIVRPSGHYKRKEPQSGSAVKQSAPQQTFPSQPPADPLPTTAELATKTATEEQKTKFLAVLAPIRDNAAKYFYALGAIGREQPLEELPLSYCPATKVQFDNVMGSIEAFIDAQQSVTATDENDVPF